MNKKIKRILATALAAITMTTAMTSTVSAYDSEYEYEGPYFNMEGYVNTLTSQSAWASYVWGKNTTTTSRYMVLQIKVYDHMDENTDTYLGGDSNSSSVSGGGILSKYYKVYEEANHSELSVVIYNGAVLQSGQVASKIKDLYFD